MTRCHRTRGSAEPEDVDLGGEVGLAMRENSPGTISPREARRDLDGDGGSAQAPARAGVLRWATMKRKPSVSTGKSGLAKVAVLNNS